METAEELNAQFLDFYSQKQFAQAEEVIRRAVELDPSHADSLYNFATYLADVTGNFNDAEQYYALALKAHPDDLLIINSFAQFLKTVRRDYDGAERLFQQGVQYHPNDPLILNNYAQYLNVVKKDYDQAELYYKKALQANENHTSALSNYAQFLKDIRNDYDTAEQYYVRAYNSDPSRPSSLNNYAQFLRNVRQDYDQAEQLYVRALQSSPKHADVNYNYAYFLRHIRRDSEKAYKYSAVAVKADAQQPKSSQQPKIIAQHREISQELRTLGIAVPEEEGPLVPRVKQIAAPLTSLTGSAYSPRLQAAGAHGSSDTNHPDDERRPLGAPDSAPLAAVPSAEPVAPMSPPAQSAPPNTQAVDKAPPAPGSKKETDIPFKPWLFYVDPVSSDDINFKLKLETTNIGRKEDNDVPIVSKYVSRYHARIDIEQRDSGRVCVFKDLNSAGGSKINDKKVTEEVLHKGDVIKLGKTIIMFMDNSPAQMLQSPTKEGPAEKQSNSILHNWQDRYFVIQGSVLYIFKNKKERDNHQVPTVICDLDSCTVEKNEPNTNTFYLNCTEDKRQYYLRFKNAEEKDAWFAVIQPFL
eukprot:TRINITY_DN2363_c0_g1_i1.p1 TRINITY_DN2363_c0_g1~~TRINITY_DN2363_c0_g1_i1.p1  ORF type:complete len:583 (-),score=159.90 TRINITY_DN2363_c0_g1_i1:276-2024(-)